MAHAALALKHLRGNGIKALFGEAPCHIADVFVQPPDFGDDHDDRILPGLSGYAWYAGMVSLPLLTVTSPAISPTVSVRIAWANNGSAAMA